jgi:hypothetical protein
MRKLRLRDALAPGEVTQKACHLVLCRSNVSICSGGKMLTKIIFILFSRVNENEVDNRRTVKEVQLTEKVTGI